MLASRSVAEGRNKAFGGVQPAAKRRADKLQTEAQREWRFDHRFVTSASTVTRRAGGRQGSGTVTERALVTAGQKRCR